MTEGERWARELLIELRRARYAPCGWRRFLAASFERAAGTRAVRRREHRQVLLLLAAGLVPWVVAAAAGAFVLAAAGTGWWLLVMLMLDWHLGMLDDLDTLGPANILSLARAAAVPALVLLPGSAAAGVFLAAGITDGIDGPLARRRGESTRLGFWLDGVTDTLVLGTAAIAAAHADLLPWWAAALVLARAAAPWPLVAFSYFVRGEPPRLGGTGRLAGLLVFAGLALALLGGAGAVLVAAGIAVLLARTPRFAASELRIAR